MSESQIRKRPDHILGNVLVEADKAVLNVINTRGKSAISRRNIQQETKLPMNIVAKCVKKLTDLLLIKEIKHGRIYHYIATENSPSNTVTGGGCYPDDKKEFINQVKDICLKIVKELKVTTADGVYNVFIKEHKLTKVELSRQQISEILGVMVLENLIIEVKSTGYGEYRSVPVGDVCYRCHEGNVNHGSDVGAMSSIPCGVCPRIRECTPDGLVSPSACVYFTKWLEF
ncbi:hypothetical protein QVD17_13801 [Tagetes erecta]|uniref:DNA-directed RNA polymerase III subunit RPC6 n=1 Tax=Tagetes erecta TaxID=13708 RepID=A0AAD8P2B8_TARER|nr:hypothetical protein QVD17_13801 [Tagetes erecta]